MPGHTITAKVERIRYQNRHLKSSPGGGWGVLTYLDAIDETGKRWRPSIWAHEPRIAIGDEIVLTIEAVTQDKKTSDEVTRFTWKDVDGSEYEFSLKDPD